MTTPTRSRGRRAAVPAAETETVSTPAADVAESENSQESNVSETAVAESPTESQTESTDGPRRGRKPMDEAERQKRATFRACESAAKLLKENGFEVTYPEGWENPEAERLRESAKRALDALRAAGIDPATVTGESASLTGESATESA
jgi:hypothetical protein